MIGMETSTTFYFGNAKGNYKCKKKRQSMTHLHLSNEDWDSLNRIILTKE